MFISANDIVTNHHLLFGLCYRMFDYYLKFHTVHTIILMLYTEINFLGLQKIKCVFETNLLYFIYIALKKAVYGDHIYPADFPYFCS